MTNSTSKIFFTFLFIHLAIWTLVPTLTNQNLPLDTIEALAWGSNLDWGFNKHPPLSAFAVGIFYQIFGNQDWAYYLLSQLFVITSFYVVYKFSEDFFQNKKLALLSVLLLEGIYFYNFITPEFNVNVCQLPFWALTVYYCWKSIEQDDIKSWLLFGLFAALGVLSKYLFFYLIIAIKIFFIFILVKEKKFNLRYFIPGSIFLLILLPHLMWLTENNYVTLVYGLHRTGLENPSFLDHIVYPLIFLGKQIGMLIPFFIMFLFIVLKLKTKFNFKDKKLLFLLTINIVPIILMFLTSILMGVKIRTMWMTPFYLFFGVLLIYIFQSQINLNKLKSFVSVFLILFIFSPFAYAYISITQTDKRTDYPGKEHAIETQKRWDKKFESKINVVLGHEWLAGNLSYHLKSRPRWEGGIENYLLTGDKMCFRTSVCLREKCNVCLGEK
jgi:4-amino-4-deoxy-L-arabinose transferase-like glycosyltransferase